MSKSFRTKLATVALLSSIAPAPASSQTTFDACYVPNVGAIYLVNLSGLPTSCLSTDHVQISWTEAGGVTDHGNLQGLADDDHPEYVREGEAAAGDLAGSFPGPSVTGLRGNAVSSTVPTDGEVLTWDGTDTEWQPRTPPTGVTDHGNLEGLADDDHPRYLLANGVRDVTRGFAVTGTLTSPVIPTEGAGVRMMWYPGKAAFRAGQVFGSEWDDANIGLRSVALGLNGTANGSVATALGNRTIASGSNSTATGSQTTASGTGATSMGVSTTASGAVASAMGFATSAPGAYATATGFRTTARSFASLAIGRWNFDPGSQGTWIDTDPLIVAGNGTSASRPSNALTLQKNGNLTIAGTLTESSDARLKTGIEPLGTVLEGVAGLRAVRFRFREGTGHPTDPQIGLLAQEVGEVFPELVTRDGRGYLSLAYPKLTAVLLKALQEQQIQILEMADRLIRLEATLQGLQGGGP